MPKPGDKTPDTSGAAGPGTSDAALSASIAKWLIPSVSVLFVVVGYIVQTAQENLLGVGAISHSPASYTDAAALFLRDLVSLPLDVVFGDLSSLGAHWGIISLTAAALVLLVASRHVRTLPTPIATWTAPAVVLLLLAAKFVAFDAPLTLVDNLILGADSGFHQLIDPTMPTVAQPGSNGPLFKSAVSRANQFAYAIECSHLGTGVLAVHPELGPKDASAAKSTCNRLDDQARAAAPRAAFTTIILTELVIVAASLLALRTHGASARIVLVGLLGVTSALTVPYAYGKLLKSTAFEYGIVRLDKPLNINDGVDTGNATQNVEGLVLAHDAAETRLLHVNPAGRCPAPSIRMQKTLNMVSLAPSEVVSIGEIQSRDVFEWSLSSRPGCQGP